MHSDARNFQGYLSSQDKVSGIHALDYHSNFQGANCETANHYIVLQSSIISYSKWSIIDTISYTSKLLQKISSLLST